MITAPEFVTSWKQFIASSALTEDEEYILRTASADDALLNGIPSSAKELLVEAGFPKAFLGLIWFDDISKGLKRIWDVYSPYSWTAPQKEELKRYIVLGADEEDNPICLDENKGGQIVILDHENHFYTWRFVNSSLNHLAASLLSFTHSHSTDELKDLLSSVDPPVAQEGTFWSDHLFS